MQPAAATFFSTVELVDYLWSHLDTRAFVCLSQTCSALDSVCSPILWRKVFFEDRVGLRYRTQSLLYKRLKALPRYGHHVRFLHITTIPLVLYVSGIAGTQSPSSAKKPEWLPEPDPRSSLLATVWSASMTQLTRLECDLLTTIGGSVSGVEKVDHRNRIGQLCWLLELNPGLVEVAVTSLDPSTVADRLLFARTISHLAQLKNLQVEIIVDEAKRSCTETLMVLFFCCPVSLESMKLRTGIKWHNNAPATSTVCLYKILGSLTIRNEPLRHLRELELPILEIIPLLEYRRILEHCPNISTLSVAPFDAKCVQATEGLAVLVKEHCQHIRHVKIDSSNTLDSAWDYSLFLGEAKSTLESFQVAFYFAGRERRFQDGHISAFRYHSLTLKDIRLDHRNKMETEVTTTILTTCAALERLELGISSTAANLPDLVSHEWVCKGLKYLQMAIDWGRFRHPTPSHLPAYYLQPSDRSPQDQDQERWGLLESFYRQIGSLIKLEELNLVASEDHAGPNPYIRYHMSDEWYRDPGRFPLLFSLGVHANGRRGYLSWLAGLKHLRALRGSVHLGNPEVAMTLQRPELEWMLAHWPKLKVLTLLPPPVHDFEEPYDEIPFLMDDYPQVEWLIEQRPGIDLHREWIGERSSVYDLWSQRELDDLMAQALRAV
ncbi:hypothetical protein BGW39_010765 [Mortierella sp. 14UC]|nr:hypothetical protein BGW39_010765 [Mortierella sp. 14UC]